MERRGVIFDMDGVLVDSYHAHFESWRRLGEEKLGRAVAEREFAAFFGRRNREIIRLLCGNHVTDEQADEWGRWKEVVYRDILLRNFPAMDGVGDLLDGLKRAGFVLAIGSSGPPGNIEAVLRGLGRENFFEATVSGAEVPVGKPEPDVFLVAARKLGLPPSRCAVVEDSLAGLEAARRASAVPIAITGTATREQLNGQAALVVDSLRQLSPEKIAALIDAQK